MDKVYITLDAKKYPLRVFTNDKEAFKEKPIDGFMVKRDLEGYKGGDWTYPLLGDCKYFNPHMNTIRELIACLYNLEGCACGGLAHIVTDDNNLEDHHIRWVLEDYCEQEENKDRTERGLVKLICEELLKLSMQERVYMFSHYYGDVLCDKDCKNCQIEKGEIIS